MVVVCQQGSHRGHANATKTQPSARRAFVCVAPNFDRFSAIAWLDAIRFDLCQFARLFVRPSRPLTSRPHLSAELACRAATLAVGASVGGGGRGHNRANGRATRV